MANWEAVAYSGCLAFLVAAHATPTNAQIAVDVVDNTGKSIAAEIFHKTSGAARSLGVKKEGEIFRQDAQCAGAFAALPVFYPMYRRQSESEKWKACSANTVVITVERQIVASASATVESFASLRQHVSSSPTMTDGIERLEGSFGRNDTAGMAIAARDLAELLEQAGHESEAEAVWNISAQSAVETMHGSQDAEPQSWLRPSGDKMVLTREATVAIKEFQTANQIEAVGVIGPKTFAAIESKAD